LDTVWFRHKYLTNPSLTAADHIVNAAAKIPRHSKTIHHLKSRPALLHHSANWQRFSIKQPSNIARRKPPNAASRGEQQQTSSSK
jgi:hypothetical protein